MEKTHTQKWEECLVYIRDNISSEQFDTWFKTVSVQSCRDGKLTLSVPSAYLAEQLEERFGSLLLSALNKVYGNGFELIFQ